MLEEVKDAADHAGVKSVMIPQKVYGALDGKGLVALIKELD